MPSVIEIMCSIMKKDIVDFSSIVYERNFLNKKKAQRFYSSLFSFILKCESSVTRSRKIHGLMDLRKFSVNQPI